MHSISRANAAVPHSTPRSPFVHRPCALQHRTSLRSSAVPQPPPSATARPARSTRKRTTRAAPAQDIGGMLPLPYVAKLPERGTSSPSALPPSRAPRPRWAGHAPSFPHHTALTSTAPLDAVCRLGRCLRNPRTRAPASPPRLPPSDTLSLADVPCLQRVPRERRTNVEQPRMPRAQARLRIRRAVCACGFWCGADSASSSHAPKPPCATPQRATGVSDTWGRSARAHADASSPVCANQAR
ncbi:hypothetical protein FB451DRAFT_1387059 [Mycena latifolia]|nr:hypothetical protein FB451DRAFT_1387059 [Mycena latifolia]